MSNQQQYPNHPPFEGGPQFQPAPPKKKHPLRTAILATVGGLVALVVTVGVVGSSESQAPGARPLGASTAAPVDNGPSPDPVVTPEYTPPAPVAPKPADFTLTAKTLSKECFGSAGCILTYTIMISYTGPELGADDSYTVIYDVRGGQDGTVTNTFSVEGDSSTVDSSEVIQTKSSKSKLTAVVTDVMES